MNHKTTAFFIAQGAMIAAAYVVLTVAFVPFSFKKKSRLDYQKP